MYYNLISEQKNVRLSLVEDNSGVYYSVATRTAKGCWNRVGKFNSTKQGFKNALLVYYRLILCNIDANIIIDIDNDIYMNSDYE